MTDEPRTRTSRLNLTFCTVAVGSTLLVLYVLSTGPFCWLLGHGYISEAQGALMVKTLYAPIDWCANNSQIFETILTAWADWWSGTP